MIDCQELEFFKYRFTQLLENFRRLYRTETVRLDFLYEYPFSTLFKVGNQFLMTTGLMSFLMFIIRIVIELRNAPFLAV